MICSLTQIGAVVISLTHLSDVTNGSAIIISFIHPRKMFIETYIKDTQFNTYNTYKSIVYIRKRNCNYIPLAKCAQ